MSFGGILRQSTAVDVLIGPFVDSTNGNDEEDGLTIAQADVRLSKNGQAGAQKNDNTTCAHDADGFYNCELDATDTDTVGQLTLYVHVAGALCARHDYQVIEEAIYDALYAASATGLLPSNATQFAGQTITAAAGVTIPSTIASPTNITAGTITTVTNLTNAATAGDLTVAMKASVNAEVLDVLNTDTFAEPGQGTPASTTTLAVKIGYLYKAWRNRHTQTASEYALYGDDAVTKDQEAVVSDDNTTFERGEISTGA